MLDSSRRKMFLESIRQLHARQLSLMDQMLETLPTNPKTKDKFVQLHEQVNSLRGLISQLQVALVNLTTPVRQLSKIHADPKTIADLPDPSTVKFIKGLIRKENPGLSESEVDSIYAARLARQKELEADEECGTCVAS